MEPTVSVIIPVYNVAPYLREALDSVVHQTHRALQVIIIDDGSTDGSSSICDEYLTDPRVTVIHQENRGLSNARNAGLERMTGEYVCFLDPDDVFHAGFVESLLAVMDRVDIAVCGYDVYYTTKRICGKGKSISPRMKPGRYDRTEALRALVDGRLNMSVWNKLYRRELWREIRFPDGHNYEDVDTMYRILDKCESVRVMKPVLYFHRQRPGSITQTITRQNFADRQLAYSHLDEFVQTHIPEIFSEAQLRKVRQAALSGMMGFYAKQPSEELRCELRKEIIAAGEENGIGNCSARVRAGYRMIRDCPRLFDILYPVYHPMRMAVLKLTGK